MIEPAQRKIPASPRSFPARLMFELALACLCIMPLAACSTGPVERNPSVEISGVVIENRTLMYISAVRLMVPVTGNFVSCGNISPESMCSTTFPGSAYAGDPVEITWSQGGEIYSTGPFEMGLPNEFDASRPAMVRVVITGPGAAGAIILQPAE